MVVAAMVKETSDHQARSIMRSGAASYKSNLVRRIPEIYRDQDHDKPHEVPHAKEGSFATVPPALQHEKRLHWARKQGVTVLHGVMVDANSGGLTVTKKVQKGTVLLSIPSLLVVQSANMNGTAELIGIFNEQHAPIAALSSDSHELRLTAAIMVLANGTDNHPFGAYDGGLPNLNSNHNQNIFMANANLLKSFKDLPLVDTVKQQQLESQRRFQEFKSMGGHISEKEWEWADSLMKASTFQDPNGGLMLIPTLDLVRPTVLASKQNVDIKIGDPSKGEPTQVVAKEDLQRGTELMGPRLDMQFKSTSSSAMNADATSCSRLSKAVTQAVPSYNSSVDCVGDLQRPEQKDLFCQLAGEAVKVCSRCDTFPCPRNFCACGGFFEHVMHSFYFDIWEASEERPLLVSLLVLVGAVLVTLRGFRLIDATKPKSRRYNAAKTTKSLIVEKKPQMKINGGGLNLANSAAADY
jgi:hypothetical protein